MHNILGKIVLSAISLVSLFSCKTDNSITDLGPFTVLGLDPFTYEYTSGTLEKDNYSYKCKLKDSRLLVLEKE